MTHGGFLLGRLIVGAYFLFNAFNHFSNVNMMSGYAASQGVPAAKAAVVVSGVLLLIAGVTFLLGFMPRLGVLAAILFFVPVTLMMHRFWGVADPAVRMAQMAHFLKNFALLGSTLMFLMIPEPWPYSVRSRAARQRGIREPVPA